jgi:hypothetical protein
MALVTKQQVVTIAVSAVIFMLVDKALRAFFRHALTSSAGSARRGVYVPAGYAAY